MISALVLLAGCPARLVAAGADDGPVERAQLATITAPGEAIAQGDILRTTRLFPNWNLNCEVQLSKAHHLCAVEQTVLDQQGAALLTWSIGVGATGRPVLAFRTAPTIDRDYGIHLGIGILSLALPVHDSDCNPRGCLFAIAFDDTLRGAMAAQPSVRFVLKRAGTELAADGPLAGMSDALNAARVDPVGLHALEQPCRAGKR